ncbi:hypothetical protein EIN_130860 [Entamoeba invadens IP1]|uniref:Uncharacterized protein n=1 Tax=Entamoeba invadens IP1 TaxID=370355 RepID=A0A0A1UD05_ENTIV|nr:hypothetical protein EIN_130860 [Entamoeba invadens IP1]ELP94317.1 hypothetical protein EIN_130860 [Entamoeba invadens IP1]|eukprot:XP_004261088.1 hypothetical protein EIN_130860 [Entamoeba invadens IP1]
MKKPTIFTQNKNLKRRDIILMEIERSVAFIYPENSISGDETTVGGEPPKSKMNLKEILMFPLILIYFPLFFLQKNDENTLNDFKKALIPFCMISSCRIIVEYIILRPLFNKVLPFDIPKKKRRERGHLLSNALFDTTVNFLLIPFSLHVFSLEDWFPIQLFGKQFAPKLFFQNFPNVTYSPTFIFFICFQLGHCTHSLVFQFVTSFTKYQDVSYHLLKSIFLTYSVLINYGRVAVVFILLLDILEVVKNIQFCVENASSRIVVFLTLILAGVVLRVVYVFPFCVIYPIVKNITLVVDKFTLYSDVKNLFIVLTTMLVLLGTTLYDVVEHFVNMYTLFKSNHIICFLLSPLDVLLSLTV